MRMRRVDPRVKARLELEMKRARWSMEIRKRGTAKLNITSEWVRVRDTFGVPQTVRKFNVFAVDITRNARDPEAGTPIKLNDLPFDTEEEAQEFAKGAIVGRVSAYFCGKEIPIIDPYRKHPI